MDGNIDGLVVTKNYFHHTTAIPSSHSDGFQIGEFNPTSGNILIKGNYFDPANPIAGETGLVFMAKSHTTVSVRMEDNFFANFGLILIRCNQARCRIKQNIFADTMKGINDVRTLVLGASEADGDELVCNRFEDGGFLVKYVGGIDRYTNLINVSSGCPDFNVVAPPVMPPVVPPSSGHRFFNVAPIMLLMDD